MHSHLYHSRHLLFSPNAWRVRLVFWGGAVLVGLVCAVFAQLAELANQTFLSIAKFNPYLPLLLTPLGMLGIAWLTLRYFPGAQGSGVPQTLAALQNHRKSHLLSWRIAFGKVFLTLLGLLAGGSIGRQGPSVQIGASIMYSIGRLARFPAHYLNQGLILAGGAAGVAAAFNTPLAGIVFAIEELRRGAEHKTSSLVIIAVVLAGATAIGVMGHYHYFGILPSGNLPDWQTWLAVPIYGVLGGLCGGLFAQILLKTTQKIAPLAARRPLRVAFTAGLLLAIIAFISGYSASGTGFIEAQTVIQNAQQPDFWYPVYKALATAASFMTGIPGGIFAPSLATGAGFGADIAHFLPIAPFSAMVLLGMVGYFTGVVQSPLTAFVIVIEITAERDMVLPLLATAIIAYGASKLVCPQPLYHTLAQAFLDKK